MTRVADEPACRKLGAVPLTGIRPEELSPLEPMSRPTLQEIHDKASEIGANYMMVMPGINGTPEARAFYCS